MQNTIIVTAIIINPEGKEIFRSEHKQAVPPDAETKAFFADMVPPIERVLSDVHWQFCPTDEEAKK
jgi:hypothetical protein